MKLFYVRSSYDVKYVIDEPLPEGVIVPTGGSYKYKETVTLEPTPSVPGYTFIGWETEDVTLSTGKFMMPTHDVTLKGRFVELSLIHIFSKPTETTAPAEDNGPAMEESTAPTESETAAPEEGTTAAPEEGTTVAPEEGTTVAPEETPTAAEESSSEAPSESETDSATEAEQTEPETTEAPETTEEKAQEPETPEAEVAEPENTTGEPVASITRHYAPIVADNEEGAVPEQPKADAAEEHVEERCV